MLRQIVEGETEEVIGYEILIHDITRSLRGNDLGLSLLPAMWLQFIEWRLVCH